MKCAAAKTRSSLVIATLNSPRVPILPVNLLGGRSLAGRYPPHLVGQPFQPLLGVVELRRRHTFGAADDLTRMAEQLIQPLPQRLIAPPLVTGGRRRGKRGAGLLGARTHAVWIPDARSSACRSSSTAARTVDAAPCSAK